MRKGTRALAIAAVVCSCCTRPGNPTDTRSGSAASASPLDRALAELRPTPLTPTDASKKLDRTVTSHSEQSPTRRAYLLTDKPLYQPGESIWMRADLRSTGTLAGATITLLSPRGANVGQRRLHANSGVAAADFELPADAIGGQYEIELVVDDGTHDTRSVVVNTYEAPRLKKTVELLRKAYGEGDGVAAVIDIERATGEPFADKTLTGIVTVDDIEVQRIALRTDKAGMATARFDLPSQIARGDGLLTVLADEATSNRSRSAFPSS